MADAAVAEPAEPAEPEQPKNHPPTGSVPIGPVPTSIDIGVARLGEEAHAIVMTFSTPLGTQTYFFAADQAIVLAKMLQRESRTIAAMEHATKKLVIPGRIS